MHRSCRSPSPNTRCASLDGSNRSTNPKHLGWRHLTPLDETALDGFKLHALLDMLVFLHLHLLIMFLELMSFVGPILDIKDARPGLPGPHLLGQAGSPGLDFLECNACGTWGCSDGHQWIPVAQSRPRSFHSAKSLGLLFSSSAAKAPSPSSISCAWV